MDKQEREQLKRVFREELWQKIRDMLAGTDLTLAEAIREVESVNQRLAREWRAQQDGCCWTRSAWCRSW